MKQIDTTTEAGWDACVKAYYNGKEMEFMQLTDNVWERSESHPKKWSNGFIRRIKPARIPEVGDVYKLDGANGVIAELGEKTCRISFLNGHSILIGNNEMPKFIGTIDLSLLKGDNE